MTDKFNESDIDNKYFIDGEKYNCPFCQTRSVKYNVTNTLKYDASNNKTNYLYLVSCEHCNKISYHLSEYQLASLSNLILGKTHGYFVYPIQEILGEEIRSAGEENVRIRKIIDKNNNSKELDDVFFYSQPSSFFAIDRRIPKKIRVPLNESEDCLKANFLTGASACLRKVIFKLLQDKEIPEKDSQDKPISHEERVNLLSKKFQKIEAAMIKELKTIHVLTSQELHENDWEDFDASTLRFLIEITKNILNEIYITPLEDNKKHSKLTKLKTKAKPQKKKH